MTNEYYIEEDYAVLAGPFASNSRYDQRYKANVIADMKRGNIPWRLSCTDGENEYIERKGMILPKRKA